MQKSKKSLEKLKKTIDIAIAWWYTNVSLENLNQQRIERGK